VESQLNVELSKELLYHLNQMLISGQQVGHSGCLLKAKCSSYRRWSARMAAAVDRPVVKPYCWCRLCDFNNGLIRACRKFANTFPGTYS